jgi:hypothetical protein
MWLNENKCDNSSKAEKAGLLSYNLPGSSDNRTKIISQNRKCPSISAADEVNG